MIAIEANALLTRAAQVDPRSKSQVERAEVWAELLSTAGVGLEEANAALDRYLLEATDPVMPAHIVAIAKRIRQERRDETRRLMERGDTQRGTLRPPPAIEARLADLDCSESYYVAVIDDMNTWLMDHGADPVSIEGALESRRRVQYVRAHGAPRINRIQELNDPHIRAAFRGEGKDMAIPVGDR